VRPWIEFFQSLQRAPRQIGSVALTTQTASIPVAVVVQPPATNDGGLFRVTTYARITKAASISSSLTVTIAWSDGLLAQSMSGAALTANTTTTWESVTALVRVDKGTSITAAALYSSTGTNMEFSLSVVAEQIP
jgi:hypothetical protein